MSYIIQPSSDLYDWWCLTDTRNLVVIKFREKHFNDTQKVTLLNDIEPDPLKLARILREMGEWLYENHKELV